MNKILDVWRRFGGYLVLLSIALALIIGWRMVMADVVAEAGMAEDTAVSRDATIATDTTEIEFTAGNIPTLNDASLAPNPNPHTYEGKLPEHDFVTHVVERGETPVGIAEQYGIKTETILGGNPQLSEESSLLQVGVELIILPVDGVLHTVQPGDTLEGLVAEYGIAQEEIVAYENNNLEWPFRLQPDTKIMVPGAVRELFVWTPPSLSSVRSPGGGIAPAVVGTGTFIYPVNSRNFTQFYWYGHPGIDIALGEGSAVVAADTGTVTFAGWNNYGYGNLIVVNHGNGYETFYAHLSGINVVPGQVVTQGQYIGASGNTGNSSGPHIHFEIRINDNRDNPCWYIGC